MNILLICIAFGNHDQVNVFLNHVLEGAGQAELRIVVVDNTPQARNIDAWADGHVRASLANGSLRIVGDGENRGYFGGFRHGLAAAHGAWGCAFQWTVLSNTDLEILTPDWMLRLATRPEDVAVVAPRITSALSGREQNPHYRSRPRARKFLWLSYVFSSLGLAYAHRMASWVKGRLQASRTAKSEVEVCRVYAAHGSFLCVSQSYFERGGRLDCPTFLFCEEIFLAEEVRRMGMSIIYDATISVVHREHETTSFLPPPHIRRYLSAAHRDAYRKLSQ
jgi:GT2 family glycosyltransferase